MLEFEAQHLLKKIFGQPCFFVIYLKMYQDQNGNSEKKSQEGII